VATLTIASFDDGACVVVVEYTAATGRITAASAEVARGELTLSLEREGGQIRSYTLGPGSHSTTNVPASLDMGTDPDSGAATITRGNAIVRCMWGG
jgi:hypothetical protein